MKQSGTGGTARSKATVRRKACRATALAALSWSGLAAAQQAEPANPSKASCAEAYESAQESRASGQLQETRQRLAFCAQPECPGFVQKDCARWLQEVERELPSVVVSAAGIDTQAASSISLKVDGQVVAGGLNGHSLSLDPGRHELVLERPGQSPISRTIMAQQGVQNRAIEIQLGNVEVARVTPTSDTGASNDEGALLPFAYAAWGVGAVGVGVFAVLGTLGRADEQGLKDDCPRVIAEAPPEALDPGVCLQSTFDKRQSKYEHEFVAADVGLVTGIVGAAAGTVLFILSATSGSSSEEVDVGTSAGLQLDVGPAPGGAWANVRGTF